MIGAWIGPAAAATVAAGMVAVASAGLANADTCRNFYNPNVRFGPDGCLNLLWHNGGHGASVGGAPAVSGEVTWPPSGPSTWPPTG